MKLKVNRQFATWLNDSCLDSLVSFAEARANLHNTDSDEHWNNRIIACVCKAIKRKFNKKIVNTNGENVGFDFDDSEVITLFKFILNYPIAEILVWENLMRQKLVEQLHKYIIEPSPFLKYKVLY